MAAVLDDVVASVIGAALLELLSDMPRLILFVLAARITPKTPWETYRSRLLPRWRERVQGTEHGQFQRFFTGTRCSVAIWREETGSQRRRAPGRGAAMPESPGYRRLGEGELIVVRQHPVALTAPALACLAGLAAAASLTAATPMDGSAQRAVWIAAGLLTGWLLWRLAQWRLDKFVLTDQRIMIVYGVVRRRAASMLLSQITAIELHQTPAGKLFGYGDIILDSTDDHDHPLYKITFVPFPDQIAAQLKAALPQQPQADAP